MRFTALRLTRAGEYGIRCILFLSAKEKGLVVRTSDIAKSMDIPAHFLGKVAKQLSLAGLVQIVQGPKGGITLARKPENISLLDVVEAITGEIFLNDCIGKPESCKASPVCSVHQVWAKTRDQLRATLKSVDFFQLARDYCGSIV